jgi:hypothetical protein
MIHLNDSLLLSKCNLLPYAILKPSYPKSVRGTPGECPSNLENQPTKQVSHDEESTISYTYSVYWREDVSILLELVNLEDKYCVE